MVPQSTTESSMFKIAQAKGVVVWDRYLGLHLRLRLDLSRKLVRLAAQPLVKLCALNFLNG